MEIFFFYKTPEALKQKVLSVGAVFCARESKAYITVRLKNPKNVNNPQIRKKKKLGWDVQIKNENDL